jgi:hypothetical protein
MGQEKLYSWHINFGECLLSFNLKHYVYISVKNLKAKIQKTIFVSVILNKFMKLGFLTLREEHRLREFENRVLRRIFGSEREEET